MSISWNDADPVDLPPLTRPETIRVAWRGTLALIWTLLLITLFLMMKGLDVCLNTLRPKPHLAARAVQVWATGALWLMGLKYHQRGQPMTGPGAFLANHCSWIDIVVLQRAAAPFFVSKSEVRDWPGIGLIGRAIGTMFVERNPAYVRQQQTELEKRLLQGDRMALFPEGTSTDGQRVLPFKSSLFSVFFSPAVTGNISAQPVCITYHPEPASLPLSFYAWWGHMNFGSHLLQVLARSRVGVVEISFLQPVDVAEFTSRKQMSTVIRNMVASEFDRSMHSET